MQSYDDRCYREDNEFELYWGIEEPSWNQKPKHWTKRWKLWLEKHTSAVKPVLLHERISESRGDDWSLHFTTYRTAYSIFVPVILAHIVWWPTVTTMNLEDLFASTTLSYNHPRWIIGLIMGFVSFLTGATGAAGTLVLFPIMTLLLSTTTSVARDFYYLAQAISMLCAGLTVGGLELNVSFHVIGYCSIGGIAGVVFGFEVLSKLQASYTEMYVACIWFAFALALLVCNLYHDGRVFHNIPSWDKGNFMYTFNWRAVALICAGALGGILSSVSGSGVELLATAVLVLLFRVSERVATPTTIILTAVNALTAALYREFVMGTVDTEVYRMLLVCVPIVATWAPIGVVAGTYLHRNLVLCVFYITCSLQLLAALCVIRPWTDHNTLTPADLSTKSVVLLVASLVFFVVLFLTGQHLLAFVDRSGLHDESTLPKPAPRRKAATIANSAAVGEEQHEVKSDDLNEYSKLSLYLCKENMTPPDRDHSVVTIPICYDETELEA